LPQWPDQMQEACGVDDGPSGGFEFLRGLVGHFRFSSPGDEFGFPVISSIAGVL
jgi:hypothetical protein